MKKRLFFDFDGTVYEWCPRATIEDLYTEGYFYNLPKYRKVYAFIKLLIMDGWEVYPLSCYLIDSKYALAEKKAVAQRDFPEIPARNYIFVSCGESKVKAIEDRFGKLTREDILLDDYTRNLEEWEAAGGTGIKLVNPVNNSNRSWTGAGKPSIRYDMPIEGMFGRLLLTANSVASSTKPKHIYKISSCRCDRRSDKRDVVLKTTRKLVVGDTIVLDGLSWTIRKEISCEI